MAKNKQRKISLPEEITWKAPNIERPDRSPFWYAMFALLSAGSIIFAIFYDGSILTLITFLLIIGLIIFFSVQTPRNVMHRITPEGIAIGQAFYPYSAVKSFWIEYYPPSVKSLGLETTAYINNKITIQLGDQDPVITRLYLMRYLYEDTNHIPSLRESLAKKLKI